MLIELQQNVSQWTAKCRNPGSDTGEGSCVQGILFPLLFHSHLKVSGGSLFEPAKIDGRCALDSTGDRLAKGKMRLFNCSREINKKEKNVIYSIWR